MDDGPRSLTDALGLMNLMIFSFQFVGNVGSMYATDVNGCEWIQCVLLIISMVHRKDSYSPTGISYTTP